MIFLVINLPKFVQRRGGPDTVTQCQCHPLKAGLVVAITPTESEPGLLRKYTKFVHVGR